MGLVDKLLTALQLGDDDEENDSLNEGYYEDDYYEEASPRKKGSRRDIKAENNMDRVPKEKLVKATPKVTPIRSSNKRQGTGMAVCVIKPTSMEDAREITETLLQDRTVVLNVEGLEVEVAQRIIDFTSGSCFAISGNLQKVSNCIFIITPPNVDISGDFQNIMDAYDVPSMKTEY
ncbi:cell division protein SepF [Lachnospiraceae bacterium ZAX-1]